MTKTEAKRRVLELRAEGWTWRAIAAEVGWPRSTCAQWVLDPDGEKSRRRKLGYGGWCRECGAPTTGCNGPGKAPKLCNHCAPGVELALWTEKTVIESIQEYARRYGRPPSAGDWNPSDARSRFRDDIADRFYEDGCWPYSSSVQRVFGSWNNAIRSAGYEPLAPGQKYSDMLAR